ncbi:hypothetical protein [Clostridium jeddahense]
MKICATSDGNIIISDSSNHAISISISIL